MRKFTRSSIIRQAKAVRSARSWCRPAASAAAVMPVVMASAMLKNSRRPSPNISPAQSPAEGADHGPVCGVGPEELPHPLAQHLQPGLVAGDHGEVARHDLHVVQRVPHQRLEQVFLVGEVQVERAVRDAGPAHHVVHAHAVEAPLLELDHARLEQPADGLPALRAQLAVLGGGAAAQRRPGGLFPRWPPGPARGGAGGAAACLLVHSKRVAFRVITAAHSVNARALVATGFRRCYPSTGEQSSGSVLSLRALNRALLSRQLLLDHADLPDEPGAGGPG